MPSKRRTLSKANFILVRILATIGFCISGYLLLLKLTGKISSLAGCGGDGGCANVLGSKWSAWVHIPVSGLAMMFYALIIVLTFQRSRSLLNTAALTLILAALWFMGIMTFVLKEFCPWCLATHITGILTALSIFFATRRTQQISWASSAFLALAPLVVLAGGQLWGPEPSEFAINNNATTKNISIHQRGDGRKVSFGTKIINASQLPILGPTDAKHILVKYFDYTCGYCRTMEDDLEALMKKHPGKFAVVILPAPLNRKCNPNLRPSIEDRPWACELAKFGLAAWRAQPESFPEIHKILFSRPILSINEARQEITKIIPPKKFSEALKDPWIDELVAANTSDLKTLSAEKKVLPKVLVVDTKVWHGRARSPDIFVSEIEKVLGL